MSEKRAILAVSFGTTHAEASKEAIEAIEQDWREAFPEMEIRSAYTSQIVRKRLLEQGIRIPGVEEALEELWREGYTHVWVQPTHLIPGVEYHMLCQQAERFLERFSLLRVGEPLLYRREDYDRVLSVMKRSVCLLPGEACIFMGHGTSHTANEVYEELAKELSQLPDARYYLATVEGTPSLEDCLAQLAQDRSLRTVYLVPFMLVAGEHALYDMAGADAESWSSRCRAQGYEVTCVLHGMGANPEIRELYLEKCRRCIGGSFYGISVGPGAGGSLTLDAAACIRRCKVLAVPRTGADHTVAMEIVKKANLRLEELFGQQDYLKLAEKRLLYLDFLMTKDAALRKQTYEEMAAQITAALQEGADVGMVVLGDVSIYATVSYLAQPIRQAGYPVKLLPGVSSFCASAAALGKSLTVMEKPLHIIPAQAAGLRENLMLPGSKVLMKSGRGLSELKELLRELGLYEQACMVRDCGMETQELCQSLTEDSGRQSYFTTILLPPCET